jgi:hypothetical protein
MIHGSMTHDFTGRKIKKKVVHGDRFKKYEKPSFAEKVPDAGPYRRDADTHYASAPMTSGNTAAPDAKKYTGTLVKGISVLHKSNAVPVINQQEMIDIANMRRN